MNLGCGPYVKPGWINVDTCSSDAELQLDLREKLPFPDASTSIVYSEHFFEHLAYPDQAMAFLRECWRVLMPGGILSMGVPDTEWPIISYANGDPEYFRLARDRFHPQWCDTRMHHLNYHFRQGAEHKYAYDFETLSKILKEVGFVDVERRGFKPGLDSENHMVSSYLEKPPASTWMPASRLYKYRRNSKNHIDQMELNSLNHNEITSQSLCGFGARVATPEVERTEELNMGIEAAGLINTASKANPVHPIDTRERDTSGMHK